jgi:hypothetical protein
VKYRVELSDAESAQEFQRVSKDLLVYDPDRGVNSWAGDSHPTMLVWAGRIFEFLKALEQITGFLPARRQSYDVGYRSGWDGAEIALAGSKALPPAEAKIQTLLSGSRILVGAGWGRCTIEYDSDTKSVVWEFSRGTAIGLAAEANGPREHSACPFISGFAAGWTNRSLDLDMEFMEVECVSRGHARCRFESTAFIRFSKIEPSR